jgi:hypothetical protein
MSVVLIRNHPIEKKKLIIANFYLEEESLTKRVHSNAPKAARDRRGYA